MEHKIPMILEKGQVSFHNCQTIHGSGPNLTDQPRRSIAIHFQDRDNQFQDFIYDNGDKAWHPNCDIAKKVEGKPDFKDEMVCPIIFERNEG